MNFQDSNNLELTEKEIEKETLPNRDSWTKNSPTVGQSHRWYIERLQVKPLALLGGIVKHP